VTYDLIVVGGGIAGSSLASRMAASGARVLIVERETQFRDRIRGESLQPWGMAEARKLGIAKVLQQGAAELRWFDQIMNGQHVMRRDLVNTTMCGESMWGFYHPEAQEKLLAHAAAAGVEVRRGAAVQRVVPGQRPKVTIEAAGQALELETRLVVLCAGRNPALRAELGFKSQRGSIPLLLSGVLLSNLPSEVDHAVAYVANDVMTGAVAALFPQPGDRARAYFGFHPQACARLQGDNDFARFRQMFTATAGKAIQFGHAQPAGPLASFECVDVWVENPYRDGVALAGDAASSNDPSWGQGLSLALRDARVLSDELLAGADWDAAGHRYAQHHDEHYGAVRKVSGWFHDLFQRLGPQADARRARALPLIAQDPTRVPDVLFSGPDFPLDANSRARFFGEDTQAAAAPVS
jgi:menaquinone-9 beta-reductase